jgi:hypothetical protein
LKRFLKINGTKMKSESDSICCPQFDPANWDDKLLEWNDPIFSG